MPPNNSEIQPTSPPDSGIDRTREDRMFFTTAMIGLILNVQYLISYSIHGNNGKAAVFISMDIPGLSQFLMK